MHLVLWFASAYALAVIVTNVALYAWRQRLLQRAAQCNLLEPLGWTGAAFGFGRECLAVAALLPCAVIGCLMPPCGIGSGARGPLLMLHGWGTNRGALWLLRRRLLRDGWNPVHCLETRASGMDIEAAAGAVRTAVEQLAAACGDGRPIMLVGHGVGGLVLRYFVRRYPAPRVRRVVTLGTPHFGTVVARALGSHGALLLPDSPVLRRLKAADRVPAQFDTIAIHSTFDATVLPLEYALYPGAFNIQFNDIGHFTLLWSRKVYRVLAENLAAPLP